MRTLIACVLSLALVGSALATVTSTAGASSVTTATFNATPDCVLLVTNSSTGATDGNWFSANYQTALFGPGAANTTIYLWGVGYTTGTPNALNLIVRTISATVAAYGNDTVEAAVPTGTADATSSSTSSLTARYATPVYAVGPASFAAAMVLEGTTTVQDLLVVYTATPTGFGTPKTIASASTAVTTGSTTTTYSYAVNWMWYEDGVYYVLFESQYMTAAGTINIAGLYIQGLTVSSGANLYTAAMAVTTSYTNTGTALGTPISGGMAQNGNYTNSTSIYVIWNDMTVAAGSLVVPKGAVLTRSTGAVTTAATTLATSTTAVTQTATGIITYNGSASAYGFVVTQFTVSGTVAVVNAYFNGNATATTLSITESSPVSGATMGRGFNYGTGYGVIFGYPATSSSQTFVTQTYLWNGTVNTTQATIGTFATGSYPAKISSFADANGALWFGYVNSDNAATKINSAYIGRLFGQINVTTTNSTFGNVLATFAALLSFVIMSLFMF